ncbi:hypothetical protein [Chitinivibrio alkaliphilus]|uniref:Uncharacterized protein n=1 Tax=Chitinivibrio alkaliphilus ACht1 TaxID=1313304 RepID=U7DAD8_9BACT|nr:hypothetical protein [Chitinivibrio alkaliphilus]ERP32097.1 hypothetical protein CALK_0817 [Chitinivibrio alkaliphilus ACht1]
MGVPSVPLLTKFKSAKKLGIPAHEFEILVKSGTITPRVHDKFGERFGADDLERVYQAGVRRVLKEAVERYRVMLQEQKKRMMVLLSSVYSHQKIISVN